MPSKDSKLLEFNQYQKSDKAPDLQCFIEKINECKYNPKNSSATKVGEPIPSGFPMSTISSFKSIENRNDVYRGNNCMKKFCESLR